MKGQGCRRTGQILEAVSLRGVRELAGIAEGLGYRTAQADVVNRDYCLCSLPAKNRNGQFAICSAD